MLGIAYQSAFLNPNIKYCSQWVQKNEASHKSFIIRKSSYRRLFCCHHYRLNLIENNNVLRLLPIFLQNHFLLFSKVNFLLQLRNLKVLVWFVFTETSQVNSSTSSLLIMTFKLAEYRFWWFSPCSRCY